MLSSVRLVIMFKPGSASFACCGNDWLIVSVGSVVRLSVLSLRSSWVPGLLPEGSRTEISLAQAIGWRRLA